MASHFNRLPKAVIFDMDGTLLDNSSIVADAYFSGMLEFGYEPKDKSFIKTLFGKSTYDTGRALGLSEEDLPKIDAYFWSYFGKYAEQLVGSPVVYEGGNEILTFFGRNNIPMAICTSNQSKSARILFQKAGLEKYFQVFVGSEDHKERKPHPGPLLFALNQLGFKAPNSPDNDFWYIGDSASDMLAAKSAKIKSIGVPEPFNYISVKQTKPDHLFRSLREFYDQVIQDLN